MHTRRSMGMATLGLLALAAGLAGPPSQAQTTSSTSPRKRAPSRKPPADKGPGETRAERDKRLQRECKGKPNAGACEGYGN